MKGKLELTWAGKDEPLLVEPRILLYDEKNSYGAQDAGNMLIHGDNLLALKALEQKFAGQVKCVYIDPPYNANATNEFYDDNFEHSTWLSLIRPRIQIIYNLLDKINGSLWISIDDDEQPYLRVLCDEIFGRKNFVASIVWQKRTSPDNRAAISDGHDYVLVYAKDKDKFKQARNKLSLSEEQAKSYKNPDNDPRGAWTSSDCTAQAGHGTASQFYTLYAPNGQEYNLSTGRCWLYTEQVMKEKIKENRIWFGTNGKSFPRKKTYLSESKGQTPWTWWTNKEVGHNQEAKKEILALFGENAFDTPKPERLIQRVLEIATNPGDLVLDSFLGSGTTAAVAHKMNRRYIGIEMGEHAYTHCKVRLDKVIDGKDAGGITKAVNWQGGGGYRFYELAGTLVKLDAHGEHIISPEYDAEKLAAAVALHEKYTYSPDKDCFWKQAKGSDNSFLFTTTRHITAPFLDSIAQTMKPEEFLTVMTTSFAPELNKAYKNITLKDIPDSLLKKCAFDVKNYNLPIVDPPKIEDEEDEMNG